MKKLKQYLTRKKTESKFKQFGSGYTLSSDGVPTATSSSGAAARVDSTERRALAAQAVERRLNPPKGELSYSQKKIQMQAKKELEEEERRLAQAFNRDLKLANAREEEFEDEVNRVTGSSLLYTCDLLEDVVLPKAEMMEAIEAFLVAQMSEEPIDASIIMIHSLNGRNAREAAISTLTTILGNILKEPDNSKYRRIRTTNKVFTEKLSKVKGAKHLLDALGFCEQMITNDTSGQVEPFLVMEGEPLCPLIQQAVDELANGSPVALKLHRDTKVYYVDPSVRQLPQPHIPPDFFELSGAEIKQQQTQRSDEVEKLTTLRTKEMREAESGGGGGGKRQQYKYSIVRVRFPNSFILQGVFNSRESLMAVREFVAQHLHSSMGGATFTLSASFGGRLDSDEKGLVECGLVPSALIFFDWDSSPNNESCFYLQSELEKRAEKLPIS